MANSSKDRKAKEYAEKLEAEFKQSLPMGGKRYFNASGVGYSRKVIDTAIALIRSDGYFAYYDPEIRVICIGTEAD